MKIPEDQSDLQKFVDNNIPESLHLDYKASDALSDKKKDEILKDVSAFANSDGGMIIYGIKEDKQNHTFSIDTGIDASKRNWQEWVGQIIDSGIFPKISGIKINSINLDSGNFAYAIEIPKSSSAPHQSPDKKYYKRSNSQSQPMEHYEIDDIRNRSLLILPLVNVDIEIKKGNIVDFVISNPGNWTAENIHFLMPDSTKNQFIKDSCLELPPILSRGLKSLPPQKTYKFFYSTYLELINNEELKKTFIEVRYFHPQIGLEKTERFDFNFEDMLNTSVEKSDIAELEKSIRDSLGKTNDHLKKLSNNIELIARNTGQIARLESTLLSYFMKSQTDPTIYEYDCRVIDVINSFDYFFKQNLSRFIYFINNDKNVSEKLAILPQTNFTTWYESAKSTRSSMAGSGTLNFPPNELERLSLLKTLFEKMATGKIRYVDISSNFMYVSDDYLSEVVRLLFIPFARDIRSFLIKNF